jgi:hypothetical protein
LASKAAREEWLQQHHWKLNNAAIRTEELCQTALLNKTQCKTK